ncbi:hypothetical protein R5R35_011250 [Gryllus longicercus]|uniref:Odorant binding protein n=1 Tax=Gryllus longicercus TaxID=2509291 RepID=A0AAN9WAY6_9ORTH
MKSYFFAVFQLFLTLTICYAQISENHAVDVCEKKVPGVSYKIFLEEKVIENPTRDSKCFLYCVYEERNLMTGNKYNKDVMIDVVRNSTWKNLSEMEEAVQKCASKPAQDECETAYEFFLCTKPTYHKNVVN